MKDLLKNKWAWTVLVLVIINIATIGVMWCFICGRGKKMECHRGEMLHGCGHERISATQKHGSCHPEGEEFLTRDLNLTEEQKTQFENLRKEHFEKLKVYLDSMQALKKSMVQSLGETNAEGTIQKIGALEIHIQKETFDHFNKMYALCTDSQKVKLKEKLENVVAHHGPNPGYKGKNDGDCENGPQYHSGKKSCCSTAPKRF